MKISRWHNGTGVNEGCGEGCAGVQNEGEIMQFPEADQEEIE